MITNTCLLLTPLFVKLHHDHVFLMQTFLQFSYHEKQRKLQELSVADRIVLNTTMAIVSNHTGRK